MKKLISILAAISLLAFVIKEPEHVSKNKFWLPFTVYQPLEVPGMDKPIMSPNATNYYVSVDGNDANTGTSAAFPWRTITKVNAATYGTGDHIYFRRGDKWHGSIVVNKNSVSFDAYGTGDLPIISGFTTISSLTSSGGNKYYTANALFNGYTNLVTLNDSIQLKSRYPAHDSLDKGWLPCTATSGLTRDSLRLVGFPSGFNVGDNIISKSWVYRNENLVLDSIKHDTAIKKRNPLYPSGDKLEIAPINNRYIFRQGDSMDMRRRGYWCVYGTKLLIYLPGGINAGVLKVSTVAIGINAGNYRDINISNLKFEGFNRFAIWGDNGRRTTVSGCEFNNMGGMAVTIDGSQNSIVTGCTVTNAIQGGVSMRNSGGDTATVSNNYFGNIGLWVGMGSTINANRDYTAINVKQRAYVNISNNFIDSVGFHGIAWGGNHVLIELNIILHYQQRLADGGAIYTFNNNDTTDQFTTFDRIIRFNIIGYGYGAPDGTGSLSQDNAGIYLDGKTKNVDILFNLIFSQRGIGVQANYPWNVNIKYNTFYGITNRGVYISKLGVFAGKVSVIGNTFYTFPDASYTADSKRYHINYEDFYLRGRTLQQSMDSMLTVDSNYYNYAAVPKFKAEGGESGSLVISNQSSFTTLSNWQSFSGQDANSLALPNYSADSAQLFKNITASPLEYTTTFVTKDVQGDIYQAVKYVLAHNSWALRIYDGPKIIRSTNSIPGWKVVNQKP